MIGADGIQALIQRHACDAPGTRLTVTRHGGHCGFLRNARLDGFAEEWIADALDA